MTISQVVRLLHRGSSAIVSLKGASKRIEAVDSMESSGDGSGRSKQAIDCIGALIGVGGGFGRG